MGGPQAAVRACVVMAATALVMTSGAPALAAQEDGVDVVLKPNGASTYYFVNGSGRLQVEVTTPPSDKDHRTFRVRFNVSQVQGAVDVTGDECAPAGGGWYHCDRDVGLTSGPTSVLIRLPLTVKSGAPAGPAGQVQAIAEQIGNHDPDTSNNSVTFTVDVDTGTGQQLRVDAGEADGHIGETVTVPVTMTNLGPNTVMWMATTFPTLVPGLEVVGHEGCAGTGYVSARLCDTAYLAGGQSRTVGVRIRIDACPDPHTRQFGHAIHTSSNDATFAFGTRGSVRVAGCAGPPSTSGSAASGGGWPVAADASTTPTPAPTMPPPSPDGMDDPARRLAEAEAALTGPQPPADAAGGDWVPVSDVRGVDSGIGIAGILALLILLVLTRALAWAVHQRRTAAHRGEA
jgi:hypothetical protein